MRQTGKAGTYGLILALTAIAFFIRAADLTHESLWWDEIATVKVVSSLVNESPLGMMDKVREYDGNPPLYYMLMLVWTKCFGQGEFYLRLPSVIFGALSVPALYFTARKVTSERASIVSAALLTLSPAHIYFSQEARAYALMFLLSLASMHCFLQAIEAGGRRHLAGYAASTAAMLYTHYYAVFILAAQLMVFTLTRRRGAARLALTQGIILAAFIPWIPRTLVTADYIMNEGFWIWRVSLFEGLATQLGFFAEGVSNGGSGVWVFGLFFLVGCVGCFMGRPRLRDYAGYTVIAWLAVPVVFPLIWSQFFTPIFLPKYALTSLAPFLIIVASGICRLEKAGTGPFLAAIAAVSLLSVSAAYETRVTTDKEDWRSMSAYVCDNVKSDDAVVFQPNYFIPKDAFGHYCKKNVNVMDSTDDALKAEPQTIYLVSRLKRTPLKSGQYVEENMHNFNGVILTVYQRM
jgi:mannosyltransferase